MEHCYQFFSGKTTEFWNAGFMYPEKNVVSYSDNLLGTSLFYMFFRGIGANREAAFQYWYLLICILNYSAAYVLMKHLFKNTYAAVLGAMVFAFSMALQSQMGHAQTYTRFPMALTLLFALKYAERWQLKWFFLTVLALVYQMYCGIYLGFLLLFPAGILLISLVLMQWKSAEPHFKNKNYLIKVAGLLLLNALLLLPLMLPYLERAKQLGFYDYHNIVFSIPTPLSYFSSWGGSLFWDGLKETTIAYPAFWDHLLFAGGLASIGIFVFLLLIRKIKSVAGNELKGKEFLALWLTALFTFLFFIRISDVSFYRVLFSFPGYGSMRALQRIINFELLFFGMGLAFLVQQITRKKTWMNYLVFIFMLALFIADNYVKQDFVHHRLVSESNERIDALILKIKDLPKNSIVSYEPDTLLSRSMDYHLDAMLACQQLGYKTLNGYTATSPGGYGDYWVKPDERSRKIWLEKNNQLNTPVVVIH